VKGHIASLLEVGTGFHPELTGRENIFLNGAIMGMDRSEIRRKFDEIVDFSGVGQFIDTPVKRYSSGMYVRLGFAVAAHLDPDILVVDEVLAVGDAAFQKKAISKMQEVSTGEGRTVLFVSHNMASIEKLCPNAILLENGAIKHKGPSRETIDMYLDQNDNEDYEAYAEITGPEAKHRVLKAVRLLNDKDQQSGLFRVGDKIIFELCLDSGEIPLYSPRMVVSISNRRLGPICNFVTDQMVNQPFKVEGKTVVRCVWDKCYLIPGKYNVSIKIGGNQTEKIDSILHFQLLENDIYVTGKEIAGNPATVIIPNGHWQFV
jgi:lipopolysaccharide transport system ATP-binding protein